MSRPACLRGALSVLVLALSSVACTPALEEGKFRCEPLDPGSCPADHVCQLREGGTEFRCYRSEAGFCGNGAIDPGEECDGNLVPATCRSLGHFGGEISCSSACRLEASDCADVIELACAGSHCVALDSAGDAWWWGAHLLDPNEMTIDHGGATSSLLRFAPLRVTRGLGLVAVAAGAQHTCGADAQGAAYCWGSNAYGQLGGGNLTATKVPSPVVGGAWQHLAAGDAHTCALDEHGAAHCWGDNSVGQLGNGAEVGDPGSALPVPVLGDARFVALTAGAAHTCGLTASGEAACWGDNEDGQAGIGTLSLVASAPAQAVPDLRFASLHGGRLHTCGLDLDGQAYCWGLNEQGQVGVAAPLRQPTPVAVSTGQRFVTLAAGWNHTCGLEPAGQAWCWGEGPLGSDLLASRTPIAVVQARSLDGLAAGMSSQCGITDPGRVDCWGWNGAGALGQAAPRLTPTRVRLDEALSSLTSVLDFTCGLDLGGQAWCWGDNDLAQLGDGTRSLRFRPGAVAGERRFTSLSAGGFFACGVDEGSQLLCWGGLPPRFAMAWVPMEMAPDLAWRAVSAGYAYLCGIDSWDQAWCMGLNQWGQLGDGQTHEDCSGLDCSTELVAVAGGIPFESLDTERGHACGVGRDGQVYCWGHNGAGQVGGFGNRVDQPRDAGVPETVTQVVVGSDHSCALDTLGQAWCWGDNTVGQLGDGTIAQRYQPVRVTQDRAFVLLAAGAWHSCGLDGSGTIWCWGANPAGQLGDGTTVNRLVPVPIDHPRPFVALVTGSGHTCALDDQGAAWCWGRNDLAQLATDDFYPTPVEVSEPDPSNGRDR
jgi:alpha-tubulin suppressor-like RCC1 family protein